MGLHCDWFVSRVLDANAPNNTIQKIFIWDRPHNHHGLEHAGFVQSIVFQTSSLFYDCVSVYGLVDSLGVWLEYQTKQVCCFLDFYIKNFIQPLSGQLDFGLRLYFNNQWVVFCMQGSQCFLCLLDHVICIGLCDAQVDRKTVLGLARQAHWYRKS